MLLQLFGQTFSWFCSIQDPTIQLKICALNKSAGNYCLVKGNSNITLKRSYWKFQRRKAGGSGEHFWSKTGILEGWYQEGIQAFYLASICYNLKSLTRSTLSYCIYLHHLISANKESSYWQISDYFHEVKQKASDL